MPLPRGRSESELERLFSGDSEMAGRMRALDWSKTPLGPITDWPHSLKTAVHIMLSSRYPMFVWWGRNLINLYNDAYMPIPGKRHPDALGRPAAEVWSDIWHTVGPQAEAVLNEGRATWSEELMLVMERNQFLEETYFTYSYSPIPDDEGGVGGVFCACTEDTHRVLSQRRLRTLRDLSARSLSGTKSAEEACQVAAATLAENDKDVPFALIYRVDADRKTARLAGAAGIEQGTAASPLEVPLASESGGGVWPLHKVSSSNQAELVDTTHLPNLPGGGWEEPPRLAIVLPIIVPGQRRRAALLVAAVSPRGLLDEAYQNFYHTVAGHIATAIANARAYEEERHRAELLAEIDRAKTLFFTNISHEFRTPLTLMLGPVEDILAQPEGGVLPDNRKLLGVVHRHGLRLLKLVNTLLDFSRIEAGRMQAVYERTDIAALTSELASMFRSAVEKAGLSLIVDCPTVDAPVFLDRDMWEKIVLNLLSNAFKFTFEGEIEVRLRQVGEAVELTVRDSGVGIAAKDLPHVFERFHRVEGAKRRTHEGTGIGMALVYELTKLHGGEVRVESVEGQGTTFTVSIPTGSAHLPQDRIGGKRSLSPTSLAPGLYVEEALRWLPDDQQPETAATDLLDGGDVAAGFQPSESAPRPRIVLADDNADIREYLRRLLSPRFDVEAVANGREALDASRQRRPDVIVTDVMMPELDGFGLLHQVRADPSLRETPVLMLSARAGEEARIEGVQAGADDYLVKPFSARELLARVSTHVELARVRREAAEALRGERGAFPQHGRQRPGHDLGRCIRDGQRYLSQYSPGTNSPAKHRKPAWALAGWKPCIPTTAAYAHDAFVAAAAQREAFRLEFRLRRKDGEYRWTIDAAAPRFGPDGRFLGYIGSVIDITERKRAEEALKESDRRKNEFLAILAHELRNPLAPIRNALEILRLTEGNRDAVQRAAAMMERQIGQMVRLVDDLLDVSRISRGKIELRKERIELASAVHHAVEAIRPRCKSMDHELTVTLPPQPMYLNADPTRLAQVVGNLLNNACKFTDKRGRIWLNVERDGGQAVIRVRDNGIGIAADELPRIFEMFTQVDTSLERTQSGFGIGLTLAKNFVELHGGELEVHSAGLGQGSEFVVRLPVTVETLKTPPPEADRQRADAHATPAASSWSMTTGTRQSLSPFCLQLTGNETHTAYDGLEAVKAAATFKPEVVLLDIGLPKMNGFEAARKIRAEPWGKKMVLVALTGWGQEEDRQKSREAGFDGHLVKPVDHAALTKLLADLGAG